MKKCIRIVFSLLALIIFMLILAVSYLVIFFDPNKLKLVLVDEVMKRTGYQLTIEGDITWSFYPNLAVHMKHMMLRMPNRTAPFLELQNVSIATEFIPLLLHHTQLSGSVNIDQVSFGRLNANHAHVGLHWQHQILTLQPMTAQLYEGTMTGIAHGSDFSRSLHWDWDVQFSHLALKPLFKALSDDRSQLVLSGLAQIKYKAYTEGKNNQTIVTNLHGVMFFDVENGALEGIDFLYFIKKVQNSMTHHSFSGNEKSAFLLRQTLFNSLTGSVTIEKGIATTNNLLLISPVLTTKASGSINLLTKALDYQLQVSPLHKAKIPWVIHILISGDLQHPVVRVDELWLNDWMMREQFEQMKVKVKQNSQALPEKANQFINHLLRK